MLNKKIQVFLTALGKTLLTVQDQKVLMLLAIGEMDKQIARSLNVHVSTVKQHREHINGKLEKLANEPIRNRTETAVASLAYGLIEIKGLRE